MAILRSELERSWARMLLMLGLLIVLFALLRQTSWPETRMAAEPGPALATPTVPFAAPAPALTPTPSAPAVQPAPRELLFPLAGYEHALRDNFHEKRGLRTHKALDIMAPRGTPIRAVDDGRVAKLYRGPMAGLAIYQFDRATSRVYFYAHLDRYADGIEEGQAISRGDVIGFVGSTGNAPETAPHLHFAVHELGPEKRWWKGRAINPYGLLRSRNAELSPAAVAANRPAAPTVPGSP